MIDDDSTWFWRISCWYTLFLSISEPIFCISMPGNVFILSDKTRTISPHKTTTSFFDFEIERVSTITNSFLCIRCISLYSHWYDFFDSWYDCFHDCNRFFLRHFYDYFFIWIFRRIWQEKCLPYRENTPLLERVGQEDSI